MQIRVVQRSTLTVEGVDTGVGEIGEEVGVGEGVGDGDGEGFAAGVAGVAVGDGVEAEGVGVAVDGAAEGLAAGVAGVALGDEPAAAAAVDTVTGAGVGLRAGRTVDVGSNEGVLGAGLVPAADGAAAVVVAREMSVDEARDARAGAAS